MSEQTAAPAGFSAAVCAGAGGGGEAEITKVGEANRVSTTPQNSPPLTGDGDGRSATGGGCPTAPTYSSSAHRDLGYIGLHEASQLTDRCHEAMRQRAVKGRYGAYKNAQGRWMLRRALVIGEAQ